MEHRPSTFGHSLVHTMATRTTQVLFINVPRPFRPIFQMRHVVVHHGSRVVFGFLHNTRRLFGKTSVITRTSIRSLFFRTRRIYQRLYFLRGFLLKRPRRSAIHQATLPRSTLSHRVSFPSSRQRNNRKCRRPFTLHYSLLQRQAPYAVCQVGSVHHRSGRPIRISLTFHYLYP